MHPQPLSPACRLFAVAAALVLLQPLVTVRAAEDPLDRRITLEARHTSLEEVCRKISSDRVRFEPGTREIADYKLHVLVTGLPLRELQAGIARLFSFPEAGAGHSWMRSQQKGATVYRLVRDPGFLDRVEALRQRPMERLRERMALLRDWDRLTPDQQEAAAREHPAVALQARNPRGHFGPLLFWSDPRAAQVLAAPVGTLNGKAPKYSLSYAGASPAQQKLFQQLWDTSVRPFLRPENLDTLDLRAAQIEFRVVPSDGAPLINWKLSFSGQLRFIGDFGAPMQRVPSGLVLDTQDAFPTFSSGWHGSGAASGPADPASGVASGQPPAQGTPVDYLFDALRLEQQSRAINLLVHARTASANRYVLDREAPVEKVLDSVGKKFGYAFSRPGELILGEDTRWALEYQDEVPVRLLDGWARNKAEHEQLTLDDLGEMSSLSHGQRGRLAIAFPEAAQAGPMCGLWHRLDEGERRKARSPEGLRLRGGASPTVPAGSQLRVLNLTGQPAEDQEQLAQLGFPPGFGLGGKPERARMAFLVTTPDGEWRITHVLLPLPEKDFDPSVVRR